MQIVQPSIEILTPLDEKTIYQTLERCGRIAYKSEDKITDTSAYQFLQALISRGHESVLEHVSISIKITCDRGTSHALVRHRIASYTQESTRYCNYKKKGMTVIKPIFQTIEDENIWEMTMQAIEKAYNQMIENKERPEIARSILPNCLKTEIIATMNIREWRHVLKVRSAPDAHPEMRYIMYLIKEQLQQKLPLLFKG